MEASTWDWGVLNLKDDNYFEAAVVLAMVQEREAQIALDNAQERKGVIDTILPGLEDTNRDLQGLLTRKE